MVLLVNSEADHRLKAVQCIQELHERSSYASKVPCDECAGNVVTGLDGSADCDSVRLTPKHG
jgi:hypothetical protein